MRIIGIAGQPSSGKDTAAIYIGTKGFTHISLGDVLREEMTKQGLPVDRPSVRAFAAAERAKHGAYYPTDIACDQISGDTVISGFRNTSEIRHVKERFPDFKLIAVHAPLEARYQRALMRNRIGDNLSFEEFKAQEEAERNNNPDTHEVDNVLALADYNLENGGSLEDLYQACDKLLANL